MKQPALHRRSAPRKGVEWVLPQSHAANSLSFMKFVSQVFHLHFKSEEMESDPKLGKTRSDSGAYALTVLGRANSLLLAIGHGEGLRTRHLHPEEPGSFQRCPGYSFGHKG